MRKAVFITILSSFAFAQSSSDCVLRSVPIEQAIEIARKHVGEPFKAWVSYSKRTGYCMWKVKGTGGYVILDARNGEVIRFYRSRR